MPLQNLISTSQSAVCRQLEVFRKTVDENEIWRSTEDMQFVFLCGANISEGIPSKRRQQLIDFADKNLPHAKFFLAESIFNVLKKEQDKSNLLDIENELSEFSDFVIIILESESAFCELGAFSTHTEIRKKLIVINDTKHMESKSFINLGPVQAVQEGASKENIIYYKMEDNGKFDGDGIGNVFSLLYKLIHKEPKKNRHRANGYNPNINLTKDSLRFLHDLIYFSGPIHFYEISRINKVLFSAANDNKLRSHIALLSSINQIITTEKGLYKSKNNKPYFQYDKINLQFLMSSFKNMYFRYDKKRLL